MSLMANETIRRDYLRKAKAIADMARADKDWDGEYIDYIQLAEQAIRYADQKVAEGTKAAAKKILSFGTIDYEKQKETIFNDIVKHGGVLTLQQQHRERTAPLREAGLMRSEAALDVAPYPEKPSILQKMGIVARQDTLTPELRGFAQKSHQREQRILNQAGLLLQKINSIEQAVSQPQQQDTTQKQLLPDEVLRKLTGLTKSKPTAQPMPEMPTQLRSIDRMLTEVSDVESGLTANQQQYAEMAASRAVTPLPGYETPVTDPYATGRGLQPTVFEQPVDDQETLSFFRDVGKDFEWLGKGVFQGLQTHRPQQTPDTAMGTLDTWAYQTPKTFREKTNLFVGQMLGAIPYYVMGYGLLNGLVGAFGVKAGLGLAQVEAAQTLALQQQTARLTMPSAKSVIGRIMKAGLQRAGEMAARIGTISGARKAMELGVSPKPEPFWFDKDTYVEPRKEWMVEINKAVADGMITGGILGFIIGTISQAYPELKFSIQSWRAGKQIALGSNMTSQEFQATVDRLIKEGWQLKPNGVLYKPAVIGADGSIIHASENGAITLNYKGKDIKLHTMLKQFGGVPPDATVVAAPGSPVQAGQVGQPIVVTPPTGQAPVTAPVTPIVPTPIVPPMPTGITPPITVPPVVTTPVQQAIADIKTAVTSSKTRTPKIVYHGSTTDFTTFRIGDIGFHFGSKAQAQSKVGRGRSVKIHEAYLAIQNPIIINTDVGDWRADSRRFLDELLSAKAITNKQYGYFLNKKSDASNYNSPLNKELRNTLEENGYDGIRYRNLHEGTPGPSGGISWIVFRNNQIIRPEKPTPTELPVTPTVAEAPVAKEPVAIIEEPTLPTATEKPSQYWTQLSSPQRQTLLTTLNIPAERITTSSTLGWGNLGNTEKTLVTAWHMKQSTPNTQEKIDELFTLVDGMEKRSVALIRKPLAELDTIGVDTSGVNEAINNYLTASQMGGAMTVGDTMFAKDEAWQGIVDAIEVLDAGEAKPVAKVEPAKVVTEPKEISLTKLSTGELIEKLKTAGWTAHYYPRKKQISISGKPAMSEKEGRAKIIELLSTPKPITTEPTKVEVMEKPFTTYDEAQLWITEKSKEYDSKNKFLASAEYKQVYPQIKKLHDQEVGKFSAEAEKAMVEAGVNYGDKVSWVYQGPFFATTEYTGVIVTRKGIPYVKFDEGLVTMNGAKSIRWHKGFTPTEPATEPTKIEVEKEPVKIEAVEKPVAKVAEAPKAIQPLINATADNPHLDDVTYKYNDQESKIYLSREELDNRGYQHEEAGHFIETGRQKLLPDKTREIVLSRGASKDTVVEETAHAIYDKLQKLNPALYEDIQAWEDTVIAKAKKEGMGVPTKGELFAQAYTFSEMGYAKANPDIAEVLSVPKRLIDGFNNYMGASKENINTLDLWRGKDLPKTVAGKRKLSVAEAPLKLTTITQPAFIKIVDRYLTAYERAVGAKLNRTDELGTIRSTIRNVGEDTAIRGLKKIVDDLEQVAREQSLTPYQRKVQDVAEKIVQPAELKRMLKPYSVKTIGDLKPAQATKLYGELREKYIQGVAKELLAVAKEMSKDEGATIVNKVRDHATGVAPHIDKTTGKRVETEEYRELPVFIRRSVDKGGMPADELASVLSISESQLMQELRIATGKLRIADFIDEATKIVDADETMYQLKRVGGGKTPETRQKINAAMHALSKEIGLGRDTRIEWAREYLNKPKLKTTKDMTDTELRGFVDYIKTTHAKAGVEIFKRIFPNTADKFGGKIDEALGVDEGYWENLYDTTPMDRKESQAIQLEFNKTIAVSTTGGIAPVISETLTTKKFYDLLQEYVRQKNRLRESGEKITYQQALAQFAEWRVDMGSEEAALKTIRDYINLSKKRITKPMAGGRIGLIDDIPRDEEMGYTKEKANRDWLMEYGRDLKLSSEEMELMIAEQEVFGYTFMAENIEPMFIMAQRGMTGEEVGKLKTAPGVERHISALARGVPEESYTDGMTAKIQMTKLKDAYKPRLEKILRQYKLSVDNMATVRDMLDGKTDVTDEFKPVVRDLRVIMDELGREGVKYKLLKVGQYVENYFPHIFKYGQESIKSSKDMVITQPWFTKERIGVMTEYQDDLFGVIDAYINSLAKAAFLKPVVDKWTPFVEKLPAERREMVAQLFQAAAGQPQDSLKQLARSYQKLNELPSVHISDREAIRTVQELSNFLVGSQVQRTMGFGAGTALRNTTQKGLMIADVAMKGDLFRGLHYYAEYRGMTTGRKLTGQGNHLRNFIDKYCALMNNRSFMDATQQVSDLTWNINKLLDKTSKATMGMFRSADLDNVRASFYVGLRASIDDQRMGMGRSEEGALAINTPINMGLAISHGNNVAWRTQYPYDIGRAAIYHNPMGRVVGIFSSWATNYASLVWDWHGRAGGGVKGFFNPQFLVQMLISGSTAVLFRMLGFAFRILPKAILGGHLALRMARGDWGIFASMLDEINTASKRMANGDVKVWGEVIFGLTAGMFMPGAAFFNRVATAAKALVKDGGKVRDDNGRVLYTLNNFADVFYLLAGHSTRAANRWELVNRARVDREDKTSMFRTHNAYETALHMQVNPSMKTWLMKSYLMSVGEGIELTDMFRSDKQFLKAIEERVIQAGLDPEDAKKTAVNNIQSYYSSNMLVTAEVGKSGWQNKVKEDLEHYFKAGALSGEKPDVPPATIQTYYNAIAKNYHQDDVEACKRLVWVLTSVMGVSKSHICEILQNKTQNRDALTKQQLNQFIK